MEILFYHLEQQPLEKILPVLLEKSLERGWKAAVEVGSAERAQSLDSALWNWRDDSFLPHAIDGGDADQSQPVLLTTTNQNANAAEIRFFVDRALPRAEGNYARLVFMFDGHDPDAVEDARKCWKELSPDNEVTYWQQDQSGRWAKKA
jgi:DNA polymerase-3 subunit chi